MSKQNISEKTILITGGTKGIGHGIAESLLALGCNVAITGRKEKTAVAAAEILSSKGKGKALGFQADVRKMEDMDNTVKSVVAEFGRLDVVVANAGLGHFGSIEELTSKQWSETIDTNLTGVFNTVKASLDPIKKSKGYFITIGSLAGTNFFPNGSAYNASKFGLVGFTQAIMLDLRQHGVKVSTIMPGSVTSHFAGHTPDDADAWKIQPEDLGQMVIDLLEMNPRTLPSKIEVRPSMPPKK
jgi:NAD(P)-dependent dehydrogenase (short-subunit alcohol dehydrogenase family)